MKSPLTISRVVDNDKSKVSWRTSDLPSYNGPNNGPQGYSPDGSFPAPFQGHRWLPVRSREGPGKGEYRSPASTLTFDAWGTSVNNWAAAAQSHYSFLQHLEEGETSRYKFHIWNYNFTRLALNFYAVRGRDIVDAFPFPTADDEEFLTVTQPKELGRPVVVEGSSMVAHFAFNKQRTPHEGRALAWTDLLARYRNYAEECVCGKMR